jgi:glutamine cyclotransferase
MTTVSIARPCRMRPSFLVETMLKQGMQLLAALATALSLNCDNHDPSESTARQITSVSKVAPTVVRRFPHDSSAFTQGLIYCGGYLYESTGLYDRSTLRRIDPADGSVVQNVWIPDVFAEGLTRFDTLLVQLTWKAGRAYLFSARTLQRTGMLSYDGEGWGLTTGPNGFIMSNGSDTLYFRDRQFSITRKLPVRYRGAPLSKINELEYARGGIYANVWYSDYIFRIDPETGFVTQVIDASRLAASSGTTGREDVLNGIAYNDSAGTFFVTGKRWPVMFEVTFPVSE